MYIQQPWSAGSTQVPGDYSGSVFERTPPTPQPPPAQPQEAEPVPQADAAISEPPPAQRQASGEQPSVPSGTFGAGPARGGIFSRFPLLSSFLPPPRGKGEKGGRDLVEWALIGLALLLFLDDKSDDILPLLLLLLLWE